MTSVIDTALDALAAREHATSVVARYADGRVRGSDRSVWLYHQVPMAPVVDATSPQAAWEAQATINRLALGLAALPHPTIKRRLYARQYYREVHLLWINVRQRYSPDGVAAQGYLRMRYPHEETYYRRLVVGVKLVPKLRLDQSQWRAALDSVVQSLRYGVTPIEDYDDDAAKVGGILREAGCRPIDRADWRTISAWWSVSGNPETPMLVHPDHLHVFQSMDAARAARAHLDAPCAEWPPIDGSYALTHYVVANFDYPPMTTAVDPVAMWVPQLTQLGAVAISIRGLIEPQAITAAHLRTREQAWLNDIEERLEAGKLDRAEQELMRERLNEARTAYETDAGYPLFHDATITVAVEGLGLDEAPPVIELLPAQHRQLKAFADMQLVPQGNANPYRHDLPSSLIGASGLTHLSLVGDADGALVGFTELDRQPAYLSPTAAAEGDELPLVLVVGQTGSGKTLVMLHLAVQMATIPTVTRNGQRVTTPVVVVDPKPGSDHSVVVQAHGGHTYSLDELEQADGALDPLRYALSAEMAITQASSLVLAVNPWGSRAEDFETPLATALAYGYRAGARCVGQALVAAREAGMADDTLVEPVLRLAQSSAHFRAFVGLEPHGEPLRLAEGLTLISVGESALQLPAPGTNPTTLRQPERIALALVRALVLGASYAVAERNGVVMMDEGWVFLAAGRDQIEQLGRLARSQGVLPMLFTQRVTDALTAGLTGYIGRGLILALEDPAEAEAACRLFRLDPTPERIGRLTAKPYSDDLGAIGSHAQAVNWDSMRALRDPATGDVLRGSIAIYCDLRRRAVPVEVTLPSKFVALASTRPSDVRARAQTLT